MFNDEIIIGEFHESTPASRPQGYEDEAIWRRIEQYIAVRWGVRTVQWIIRGPGLFVPPLHPTTITSVERFNNYGSSAAPPGGWVTHKPIRTPFGVEVPPGYFRLQGSAGHDETPPADVLEAYSRLHDYLSAIKAEGSSGITSHTDAVPGVSRTVHRPAQAMARALEYSGAADILKAYRHV
ncbi:hypothetical protein EII18_10710 [Comamonadaceae bacterium OH3737_COT-264]|nr:hypothetical protein EII18_10710 [Comamonadaceae bacterium OH3737_COT-264]